MFKNVLNLKLQRKHVKLFALLGTAAVLAFLFAIVLPFMKGSVEQKKTIDTSQTQEVVGRHPLTGFSVYDDVVFPNVFGVMIDNHIDAWPQAGIDQAFLVYEAPVEAGISRLLAFYYDGQDVAKIGPIRSARPYFLDWNNELDAVYTHVGGSNEALDLIASGGTFDLNQYWFGDYFWRANDRYAPHNVYTSTNLLHSFLELKKEQGKYSAPLYESWLFKDPQFSDQGHVEQIKISFLAPAYVAQWNFDALENRYTRLHSGFVHTMENGVQIKADNIAVVVTDVSVIDSIGRRQIQTIGSGQGFVFQDGKAIHGTWEKQTENQRIRFFDENGNEMTFNPGVTWVEVVPSLADVTF